jgi:hypothetical protein
MHIVRKLALVACCLSAIAIGANFAQAAPGLGQAAPSVLLTETSRSAAAPFVEKAWWHHHCCWHHWHHWHHW